jgi:hypothetical protein
VLHPGSLRPLHTILVGEAEGKRPLGRQRRTCVDNIRLDLGEIGWVVVEWIVVAQDRDR